MSKRNVELERLLWPKDSLKRSLLRDFPGCSNSLEALKKVIESKNQTAAQLPLKEDLPELLRTVIKQIEESLIGIDLDLIPIETRDHLKNLSTETKAETLFWRDSWLKEINKVSW